MNKKSPQHLRENDIKALLISRLKDKGCIDTSDVLISEYTVDDAANRADLVVVKAGGFEVFEIKSEADSLTRLTAQIKTYQMFFDKVTVVAARKHIKKILETTPQEVAVWCIDNDCLKTIQRGKKHPVRKPSFLFKHMTANDLKRLASHLRIQSKHLKRKGLEESLSNIPIGALRKAVSESLAAKYGKTTQSFWAATNGRISRKDIEKLSPYIAERKQRIEAQEQPLPYWTGITLQADADYQLKQQLQDATQPFFGDIPESIRELIAA